MSQRSPRQDFDNIALGDIIHWGTLFRKVRAISHYPDGRVKHVSFAIARVSWTSRPYTVYFRADVARWFKGILHTGVSLCSTNELECRVQRDVESKGGAPSVSAYEMVGIIY